MTKVKFIKKSTQIHHIQMLLTFLLVLLAFTQNAYAEGVFGDKNKAQHQLNNTDLNRLKAEYQIKFGRAPDNKPGHKSGNVWDKKKEKNSVNKASWAECREYALHKRNRCYRDGRAAYSCERVYDARIKFCNDNPE